LHTNNSHAAVAGALKGLRPWGKLVLMGIAGAEMALPALALTSHSYQVIGSAINGMEYLAEALELVARGEVQPMVDSSPRSASPRTATRSPPATCASKPS
jgi:alcohol dehydrogenase/propanol-preferring alcohol dehydrogenase